MRNFRLTIEYDGSGFHGWQVQPGLRTIQGEIQRALKSLLQEKVTVVGAGRTDAGVHALGQVAHLHTETRLGPGNVLSGLNALLPDDVVIHRVEEAPLSFHARFDAARRVYRYRISTVRRAVERDYVWYVRYPLDVERMDAALSPLIGAHDFTSFCAADSDVEGYTCTATHLAWSLQGAEIILDAEADRFLRNMVRAIVGTSGEIGRGRLPPEAMAEILRARDRRAAGPTAPARGLCLVKVLYEA